MRVSVKLPVAPHVKVRGAPAENCAAVNEMVPGAQMLSSGPTSSSRYALGTPLINAAAVVAGKRPMRHVGANVSVTNSVQLCAPFRVRQKYGSGALPSMSHDPPAGGVRAAAPRTAVTTHRDVALTLQAVPALLQVNPDGQVPHVRLPQLSPGSTPHILPAHADTHSPDPSQRPAALHVRPTAQVPHEPPQPSDPHSRPVQLRTHAQRPLALHTELPAHDPQVRPSQNMPGSGPHSRPVHPERQVMSGGTQRPATLQPHPAMGHVPHEPPAPSEPHSRPVQSRMEERTHAPLMQT